LLTNFSQRITEHANYPKPKSYIWALNMFEKYYRTQSP